MIADMIARDLWAWFSMKNSYADCLDRYISQSCPQSEHDIERLTREFEHKYSQGIYR